MSESGIRRVYLLAGAYEPELRELVGAEEHLGVEVHYVSEDRRLGTPGALELAQPYLGREPFLVIHGDVLTDIDVAEFVRLHLGEGSLATIAVKPRHSELHYGRVLLQRNRIATFCGTGLDEGISIVNTGVYLCQPAVFDRRPVRLSRPHRDRTQSVARGPAAPAEPGNDRVALGNAAAADGLEGRRTPPRAVVGCVGPRGRVRSIQPRRPPCL